MPLSLLLLLESLDYRAPREKALTMEKRLGTLRHKIGTHTNNDSLYYTSPKLKKLFRDKKRDCIVLDDPKNIREVSSRRIEGYRSDSCQALRTPSSWRLPVINGTVVLSFRKIGDDLEGACRAAFHRGMAALGHQDA